MKTILVAAFELFGDSPSIQHIGDGNIGADVARTAVIILGGQGFIIKGIGFFES